MQQDQNKVVKIVDQYVIDKENLLGKGTYGKVYSGIDSRDQKQLAVKTIPMDIFQNSSSKLLQNIKNEIRNMQLLHHPNIVKLYDVKKSANNLYLIVEFCNSGNLEYFLRRNNGRLSELQSIKIIRQIIEGFKCLYKNNIVHRDLKPENILIHNDEIKISDFGFSKVVDQGMEEQVLQSIVGSPMYMSPQILGNENYSSKTDIWSLGMIFYQMLYGKTPWMGKSPMDLLDKIESKQLQFPEFPVVNPSLKVLITNMLKIDENQRVTWEQLFQDSILQDESQELQESLQSMEISYKNDILLKNKAINKIYYDQNKVINSAFECQKRQKINQIILQQFQMDQQVNSNSSNQSNQSQISIDNNNNLQNLTQKANIEISKINAETQDSSVYQSIFNQNKINQQNKQSISQVIDWVLHRRNLASFYMHLAQEIFQMQQELKNNELETTVYYRAIFVLLKYHTSILFKLYKRLKSNEPEKYKKFTINQYQLFMKSEEKHHLLTFIKSDLNISKLFFDEYLKMTKTLLNKRRQELPESEVEKLEKMEDILNNKISNKNIFKSQWSVNIQEFTQYIIELIKNQNLQSKQYQIPALYCKMVVENSNIFKFNANKKIDFAKFYEDVQRMNPETLSKRLFNMSQSDQSQSQFM